MPCLMRSGTERVVGRTESQYRLVVALRGGQNGGVVGIGGGLVGVFFCNLVGEPGLNLRGGASSLRHLKRCDDMPLVIDDGKATLQRDLMLAQDLVDRFTTLTGGGDRGGTNGAMRRGVDGAVKLLF